MIEVVRREQSVVELRRIQDPVQRYIDDAFAVAFNKDDVPGGAARHPGLLQVCARVSARLLEATRMLHQGKPYAEVEAALAKPNTLRQWLALALLNDIDRSGDVITYLSTEHPWAVDSVKACNRGAHSGSVCGDMGEFIRSVEQLTKKMLGRIDVSAQPVVDAHSLVSAARDLMREDDAATVGLWPRAAALLARQGLELAMVRLWEVTAPGLERTSTRMSAAVCRRHAQRPGARWARDPDVALAVERVPSPRLRAAADGHRAQRCAGDRVGSGRGSGAAAREDQGLRSGRRAVAIIVACGLFTGTFEQTSERRKDNSVLLAIRRVLAPDYVLERSNGHDNSPDVDASSALREVGVSRRSGRHERDVQSTKRCSQVPHRRIRE